MERQHTLQHSSATPDGGCDYMPPPLGNIGRYNRVQRKDHFHHIGSHFRRSLKKHKRIRKEAELNINLFITRKHLYSFTIIQIRCTRPIATAGTCAFEVFLDAATISFPAIPIRTSTF